MNRLINLIINKRINKNINKFTIAKFVNDYKKQFISGELDFNCLHSLHIIMWSRIVQYYEDYIFGPIRIDKVKQKILNKIMKDIKKQKSCVLSSDQIKFISNLESLFRTIKKYNHNCFACYCSCYNNYHIECNCEYCPMEWGIYHPCFYYGELFITTNKKYFKKNKQYIINLCKTIKETKWKG